MEAWLRDEGGVKFPIGVEGVLLGRDPACAVVIADPTVSRRHVLVLRSGHGLRVVPLSKQGVRVDGRAIEAETQLPDGTSIEVGVARFTAVVEGDTQAPPAWSLEREEMRYSLRSSPFLVGGAASDNLVIEGWPANAATLHLVDGAVVLESPCGVLGAGRKAVDEPVSLRDRDVLSYGSVRLKLRAAGRDVATTVSRAPTFPTQAELEFLPNGGLLKLVWNTAHVVWLPDRRCDLMATLLKPPRGAAGEFVEDESLADKIWPGEPFNRVHLNMLVYRLRLTLSAGGVDGASLIERAKGGGGTRVRLARGANIEVR